MKTIEWLVEDDKDLGSRISKYFSMTSALREMCNIAFKCV